MDLITRTPGLIHIAEQIFSKLDRKNLLQCQEVNEYWATILRNPWFWYNRIMKNTTLSKEHQKDWMNFCEKLNKLDLTKDKTAGLNFIYEHLENSVTLNKVYHSALSMASAETIEIMAPLIESPNAPNNDGETQIFIAAMNGHTEIVKILAPLTDPDALGFIPLKLASNAVIRKILKVNISRKRKAEPSTKASNKQAKKC